VEKTAEGMRELTIEERRNLADAYAPILVLYPQLGTDGIADSQADFHPCDIRLVLGQASARIRFSETGIWSLLPGLGRQWPHAMVYVASVAAAIYCFLSLDTAIDLPILTSRWSLIVALVLAPLAVASLVATIWAAPQIDRWFWRLPYYGIALSLIILPLVEEVSNFSIDWDLLGNILIIWWVIFPCMALLWILQRFLKAAEPDPHHLLDQLEKLEDRKSFPHLVNPLRRLLKRVDMGTVPQQVDQLFRDVDEFLLWRSWVIGTFVGAFMSARKLILTPRGIAEHIRIEAKNRYRVALEERPSTLFLQYYRAGSPRDRQRHRDIYVSAVSDERRSLFPPTIYAHVVSGRDHYKDFVAVQYWIAYFFNDWQNTHEMDWEQVTVYLRWPARARSPEPVLCAMSAHFGGTVCEWADVLPLREWNCPKRPVVFIARGSHANYARPGPHQPVVRFAGLRLSGRDMATVRRRPLDAYTDWTSSWDKGTKLQCPQLKVVVLEEPDEEGIWRHTFGACCKEAPPGGLCREDLRWLNLKGKWGSPGGLIGGDAAPKSPPCQPSWDPFVWLDDCERLSDSVSESLLLAKNRRRAALNSDE